MQKILEQHAATVGAERPCGAVLALPAGRARIAVVALLAALFLPTIIPGQAGASGRRVQGVVAHHRGKPKPRRKPRPKPTPAAAPAPPVVGLSACRPGPSCFYGPIYNTYSNYGNVAPADLGDCTFAAVADWEQIVLGLHPDASVIGFEFGQAGGDATAGLSLGGLISYWQTSGIDNVPLYGLHAYSTDPATVEEYVRLDAALLVEFQFSAGASLGQYAVSPGGHMAVVDGFTPAGPLVVSWGETLQVTWTQWNASAVRIWRVSTSATSAPGPGVTPATNFASGYQVTSCWSQYTGGSWTAATSSGATASFSGADILSRGPSNFWSIVTLANPPPATISGVTATLYEPDGSVFSTSHLSDWGSQFSEWSVSLDWTFWGGALFFQYPGVTGTGSWLVEWSFPDGQTCLDQFTVN